jgi:hypothetical protein
VEQIQRELHGVARRVLGEEHSKTFMSAISLATSLSGKGKDADLEAERIFRDALDARRRVLGVDHPHTLQTSDVHFDARKARRGGADLPGDD